MSIKREILEEIEYSELKFAKHMGQEQFLQYAIAPIPQVLTTNSIWLSQFPHQYGNTPTPKRDTHNLFFLAMVAMELYVLNRAFANASILPMLQFF